jgi:membrane protein YqaA with SNARE-associated domain
VREFLGRLFYAILEWGAPGLVVMGVLDSSFLFMPLGNDLLVVALTARHPAFLPIYAVLASAGSVAGCAIMAAVGRKGGEASLEKNVASRRLEFVKRRVKKRAGWALGLAALMPPPFPFTLFIVVMGALDYPRKKLLGIVAVSRLLRFGLIGLLAVFFGGRVLALGQMPEVQYAIFGLIVLSMAGSTVSVYRWLRRSRADGARTPGDR